MNNADFSHVLIVDDNQDASEALALLIETEGFTTATARTLREARERLLAQKPRVMLLDINLPDGNGLSLLAEVKNDVKTADIHVVMLSGFVDDRLKEEAHLLGAAAFLLKPFEHVQLMALLDSAR
ncbi:MAG: response regulator [Rubrivivax sp.]|nr:MAG: response regulator [Rubrivivax sp.]